MNTPFHRCLRAFTVAGTLVALAATPACSAAGGSEPPDGNGGTGATGGSDNTGGQIALVGGNAGATAFAAHVERDGVTVQIITLSCAEGCADVEAVASGGNPPYTFRWEDGSTSPARHLCPKSTTAYEVSVTDSGVARGEFSEPPETVHAPLTANVLSCPDGGPGRPGADGGGFVCSDAGVTGPAPGRYVGTITCPASTSSGGAAGATGSVILDFLADGTGSMFFRWSLQVIGATGTLHPAGCIGDAYGAVWDGMWGVPAPSDPNNPNEPPPLLPTGPITGDLTATPTPGNPAHIEGRFDWNAPPFMTQPASICVGTFTADRV